MLKLVITSYSIHYTKLYDSKIEGEKAKMRTYLSPQRAILLHIIENNYSERPVFFSVLANNFFYGGLDEYFQNCGLVYRLVPVKTIETDYGINSYNFV